MKCDKYMGMDVHQATTVVVVLDAEGQGDFGNDRGDGRRQRSFDWCRV